MSWQDVYRSKLMSADDAVKLIPDNSHVYSGHEPSEPPELYRALVRNADYFHGLKFHHMNTFFEYGYCTKEMEPHFRYEGFYVGGTTRNSITEGYGSIIPAGFYDVANGLTQGYFPIDACIVRVTPPDNNGDCHIVCEAGYTYAACKAAKVLIGQVTETGPVVFGDTALNVSEFDALVEHDDEMMYLMENHPFGTIEQAIGDYCASLIEDGATLQIGVGKLPDAVMASLTNHKHLGLHTEIITDAIVDMYKKGIIDGSQKSLDKGIMMGTFVTGLADELYQFVDKNPEVMIRSAAYTNSPWTIASQSKMTSINATLQVDIMGQAVSDNIGMRQYSGIGGQVDFVRGVNLSRDGKGKTILLLPSVTRKKDGTVISKICPVIDHGAAVTCARFDTNYVITEYGIAQLRGKTLQERGEALINIAHPDFREELSRAFYERYHVMPKGIRADAVIE